MYQLTSATEIIRLADSAVIPSDDRNIDYQGYLAWLNDGGIPRSKQPTKDHQWIGGEWVYAQPVPQEVTMRQARLALLGVGLLDSISTAIDFLPSPQKEAARIEWEYSQAVQRDKALVLALAPALGLSDADLDQLFITAATL
tara:strand:+ start:462026 stop:462451 length:426 start_codon:yes stop_codon:yes gene_type:complete